MIKRKLRKWLKSKILSELDSFYLALFTEKIRNKLNFSFSRFGDGEWTAILNLDAKENCDGHQYFNDMGEQLKHAFTSSGGYYKGIQPLAWRTMSSNILPLSLPIIDSYFNADIFHKASEYQLIQPFFDALNTREVVLVGPSYLSAQNQIKIKKHIPIPLKNCWLDAENILKSVRKYLDNESVEKTSVVVLFCASMAANVFVDILHKQYRNQHSFLDVGSLLDPYANINTRGYHKKLKVKNSK